MRMTIRRIMYDKNLLLSPPPPNLKNRFNENLEKGLFTIFKTPEPINLKPPEKMQVMCYRVSHGMDLATDT